MVRYIQSMSAETASLQYDLLSDPVWNSHLLLYYTTVLKVIFSVLGGSPMQQVQGWIIVDMTNQWL